MNNHIDTSKGKYIDITKLEKMIRDNEYSFICEEDFSYYSYGMTTDDFIDLINDCKRVNLGKAVSKRTPKKVASKKVASKKVASSKKALLDKFCPSCYKNLTMFSASLKYNYCPNCGQRLDWSDNLNAKEYLNRVRFADISINTKSDELELKIEREQEE